MDSNSNSTFDFDEMLQLISCNLIANIIMLSRNDNNNNPQITYIVETINNFGLFKDKFITLYNFFENVINLISSKYELTLDFYKSFIYVEEIGFPIFTNFNIFTSKRNYTIGNNPKYNIFHSVLFNLLHIFDNNKFKWTNYPISEDNKFTLVILFFKEYFYDYYLYYKWIIFNYLQKNSIELLIEDEPLVQFQVTSFEFSHEKEYYNCKQFFNYKKYNVICNDLFEIYEKLVIKNIGLLFQIRREFESELLKFNFKLLKRKQSDLLI